MNVEYCVAYVFLHLFDCDPLVMGPRGFFGVFGSMRPCGVLGVLFRFLLLLVLGLCVMVVVVTSFFLCMRVGDMTRNQGVF